jgi:hypothetical protein
MKKHINKDEWVAMYEEMGLNASKRKQWHKLFESRHPDGHQSFLEWLGLPSKEIDEIRAWSR